MNMNEKIAVKARISYPNLDKPRAAAEGATPKYSARLMIPKDDHETIRRIKDACKNCFENNKGMFKGFDLDGLIPLHDGAGRSPRGKKYDDVCKDYMLLNANNTRRPKLQDFAGDELLDASDIYSGCWCKVGLAFYPFAHSSNTGIGVSLDIVRFYKDGEHLAGEVKESDYEGFDAEDDDDV